MKELKKYDFDSLIQIQKEFNEKIFLDINVDINSLEPRQHHAIMKDYCIHLIDEVMEVLRELNWKMHKNYDDIKIDKKRILEEFVDIDKFFMNMLMIMKITEDEFVDAWNKKTKIVYERYENEQT